MVRRRYSGEVVEERSKDVIAAEYRHTTARGVTGASHEGGAMVCSIVEHENVLD